MSERRDDKPRTGVGRNGSTIEPSVASVGRAGLLLAAYGDPGGGVHRVVLRGRFVLDLAAGERPRVVCQLADGEGEEQARATLEAGCYLDRARLATEPLCRRLTAADLRPPADTEEARGRGRRAA